MHISVVSDDGDRVKLKVEGEIMHEGEARCTDPIGQALGPECYRRCVLFDLSGSDYIGSSGVSWLVIAQKRFRSAGGRLIMHSAPPIVRDVIKIMRLDLVLDWAETERQAEQMARGDGT